MSEALAPAPTWQVDGPFDIACCGSLAELQSLESGLRADERTADFYATWPWFENLAQTGIEPEFRRMYLVVRQRDTGASLCMPLLQRPRGSAASPRR